MFSTVNVIAERERERICFQPYSCNSVLEKINSCVPERWYMSIQIGWKAEWINRVLNGGLHAQRSTLQRPQKIYQRRASPVRFVRVDDDAGVHVCGPALGWAVVVRIRHLPIFGVGNRGGGKRRWEMRGPNAVRGRTAREKGGGEEKRIGWD